ncbi:aspartokinase [Psychrosphaera saromensis]|uniref:Aspartokinase n=1 Tax=Psychrosphaera saromensis TaxID=716813 RepID=A0A2S7UWQ6_9GAMM|nr:lysine-sensitive aspartokinase 3 [Psychrosphaera saromensis]PQJ54416.1 lysine-sensitive aspartokinase 3 [Psychrosphaera saromensis]GHB60139.1 aspartokinase [Psychrosphaera saromensis]GLQ14632.1 aspartokinase [Psychrosphaera saromensis]
MSPINSSTIVAKFGGTSVANFEAMSRCAQIILNNPEIRLVVVSASAGVTNLLVKLGNEVLSANEKESVLQQIRNIQNSILNDLGRPVKAQDVISQLIEQLAEIALHPLLITSTKLKDELLSFGERMSSVLFAEVINKISGQASAVAFDGRQVLKTDSSFAKAEPQLEATRKQANSLLKPLLKNKVVITQGFIGQDNFGNTTTLGRGGSDYSAALFAEAVDAFALQIWTDVTGIYTTDPRITDKARPIKEISFDEAAEMATFGAKILHPATLIPAIRSGVKVFVGSSLEPDAGGTWISKEVDYRPAYRAVALRNEQTLLTVKSPEMLHATGFLARVFAILAKHKLSVDLITTSEISVALTIDNPANTPIAGLVAACVKDLSSFCDVNVESELALVAVIGNHVEHNDGKQGGAGRIFSSLEDDQLRLICHGASEHNVCFLVKQENAKDIVRQIHDDLFSV